MTQDDRARGGPAAALLQTDVIAGLLLMAIAAGAYVVTSDLSNGTPMMLGSGFMPHLVAGLLFLFGAAIFVTGLRTSGTRIEITSLRPLLLVTACIGIFAATLEWLGLVPAICIVVGLSFFAGKGAKAQHLAFIAIGLSALCVMIFIWGAKLPIPMGPF